MFYDVMIRTLYILQSWINFSGAAHEMTLKYCRSMRLWPFQIFAIVSNGWTYLSFFFFCGTNHMFCAASKYSVSPTLWCYNSHLYFLHSSQLCVKSCKIHRFDKKYMRSEKKRHILSLNYTTINQVHCNLKENVLSKSGTEIL